MSDIDNDGRDDDARIVQALWELVSHAELDDLRFERLARQIGTAGATRLRRRRAARRTIRMQWMGGVISAGLAASAALFLVLLHTTPSQQAVVSGDVPAVPGAVDRVREDRRNLFAASVGEISEDDFVATVWGHVDAETLLGSDRQ